MARCQGPGRRCLIAFCLVCAALVLWVGVRMVAIGYLSWFGQLYRPPLADLPGLLGQPPSRFRREFGQPICTGEDDPRWASTLGAVSQGPTPRGPHPPKWRYEAYSYRARVTLGIRPEVRVVAAFRSSTRPEGWEAAAVSGWISGYLAFPDQDVQPVDPRTTAQAFGVPAKGLPRGDWEGVAYCIQEPLPNVYRAVAQFERRGRDTQMICYATRADVVALQGVEWLAWVAIGDLLSRPGTVALCEPRGERVRWKGRP